ncbi:MAG: two-component regulator propeller domain-containing protein [Chloroflexota bacterium]|nr:two-component regulator propeller domain-containing protein [Chloroflexota bacterium]
MASMAAPSPGALMRRFLAVLLLILLGQALLGTRPVSASPQPPQASGTNDPISIPNQPVEFEHISLDEGLSSSTVTAVLEDSRGFMWFGTARGLNQYDGYQFKTFVHDPDDPGSIGADDVLSIVEDLEGVLWIGTSAGLDRFDRDEGRFTRFTLPDDDGDQVPTPVNALFEDRAGFLWVGAGNGLFHFDRETGNFHSHQRSPNNPGGLGDSPVYAIFEDNSGVLWIGARRGLYAWPPEAERFKYHRPNLEAPRWEHNVVQSIAEDQEGMLWIGTGGGGFFRFDPTTYQFSQHLLNPRDVEGLTYNNVAETYVDSQGVLWIGSVGGGLYQLDPHSGELIAHRSDPGTEESLSSNYILSLAESQPGVLWVGTWGGGVNKYDRLKRKFLHIRHDPAVADGLSPNPVIALLEDSRGLLWIGTEGGGMSVHDLETGMWRTYRHDRDDPTSLNSDYVTSFLEDRAGNIWVGTWEGGLCRFDVETEQCTTFRPDPLDPTSLGSDITRLLFQDENGTLWIAAFGAGLDRLEQPEMASPDAEFFHYWTVPNVPNRLSGNRIIQLTEDAGGIFWLATMDGGLNRFDRGTGEFTNYREDPGQPGSLSSDATLAVTIDSSGDTWVGTDAGLNRFDPDTGTFEVFTQKDGLPDDSIMGILEDDAGYLWLSTQRGLARFNPRTGASRNFTQNDGLQGYEFNLGYAKSESGPLYFGGIDGLNVVYPGHIPANPYVPPVVLTSLKQNGSDISEGKASDGLEKITLRWPSNDLEFEYAALNFSQPERNQYAYFLDGFDSDWNYVGDRRFGRYTNLPGGDYLLRVKASNSDGVWNDEGASLAISVVPPFWQTRWFQGLALGLLVASAFLAYRLRVRSIEDRSHELESEVAFRTYEIQERNQELDALYRADEELYSHLQLDDVLQSLVNIAVDSLQADKSVVLGWGESREKLVARVERGFSPEVVGQLVFEPGKGVAGHVARTGEAVAVRDATNNEWLAGESPETVAIVLAEGIRSFMHLPITVNNEVFGVFNVSYTKLHAFGENEKRTFSALAQRAAQAIENARMFDAEQRRAEQFQVISEVGSQITAIMSVEEILQRTARLIEDTFGYYHVGIGLVEGDQVIYRYGAGDLWDDAGFDFEPAQLKVGSEGVTGWVAATGKPLSVPDVREEPRYVLMQGSETRSELTVPMIVKGKVIGVLDVQSRCLNAFDDIDLTVLQALAHQAGAAIENTQLYEQAQKAAVVEERSRLARDLHDAVTQSLFSATLLSEVLPTTWESDRQEGETLLRELSQLNRGALAEMRTLLLELRPAVLADADLADLMNQLADAVTGRTGMPVDVQADKDCRLEHDVHIALYRIAQEALNNVVKHSRAGHVTVQLKCMTGSGNGQGDEQFCRIKLQISDDGIGFDPEAIPQGRLGLGIIQERAEAIGADLSIETAPGEGSRVTVTWRGSPTEGDSGSSPDGALAGTTVPEDYGDVNNGQG